MKITSDLEKEVEDNCGLKIKEILSTATTQCMCRASNDINDLKTIKIIQSNNFFKSENLKAQILHELKIAKTLVFSNNFIKLEQHIYTPNFLILIYEDFQNFCLESLWNELDIPQYISIIFKDLVDAVVILRENKLIHHQITLRNVFLINGFIKLGGLEYIHPAATPLPSFYNFLPKSLEFSAPEFHTKKNLIFPSQVFSLGILIHFLLFDKFPFPSELKEEKHFREFYQLKKILNLVSNDICPEPNIFLVMKECLPVEYAERITLRYLKNTLDAYCKNKGSMLNIRKNAMSKNKENQKKNIESANQRKDSSFNSYKLCEIISIDEIK